MPLAESVIESEGTMRWLEFLVFGTGVLMVGCGGSDEDNPVPNPTPGDVGDYCAEQHTDTSNGEEVVVCDELYSEAPFVHLPESTSTRVFAGLQQSSFITVDGETFGYQQAGVSADPEQDRHAVALYELTLEDGKLKNFRPAVLFDEALFVEPFMNRAFEGTVSRWDGQAFSDETSLPVRVELSGESTSSDLGFSATGAIANLHEGVSAADGSCMPALSGYGDEAPFAEGVDVEIVAGRAPWMHGNNDDEFVLDVIVDGTSVGTLMAPAWYRGPIDLVRGTLAPSDTYEGFGHGTPGAIPQFTLEPIDEGGEPCTP
jgi:hypothetical protein